MRIANGAKKLPCAMGISNQHVTISKVVADLYNSRMPWLKALKCHSNKPEQAEI